MCETCVNALANAVERDFKGLQSVELGLRAEQGRTTLEYIHVPEKEVEFESGERVRTAAFLISKRPVTIGEYKEFAQKTHYITVAEQRRSTETFDHHCGLSGMNASIRLSVPVQFVTIDDAGTFCRYSGCRLPSEAEWLAAAVLQQGEVDIAPLEELQRHSQPTLPNLIEVNNWDITASHAVDGRVVARRGPVGFLKRGWRHPPLSGFNRRLIRLDEYDMSVTFRVARNA